MTISKIQNVASNFPSFLQPLHWITLLYNHPLCLICEVLCEDSTISLFPARHIVIWLAMAPLSKFATCKLQLHWWDCPFILIMTHLFSWSTITLVTHAVARKKATGGTYCVRNCTQLHKMLARFKNSAHSKQLKRCQKQWDENPYFKCCILSLLTFILLHQTVQTSCFVLVQVFFFSCIFNLFLSYYSCSTLTILTSSAFWLKKSK